MRPRIVDAHCHTSLGGVAVPPGGSDMSLRRYSARAREAGIDTTILLAPPVGQYRRENTKVGALVTANPGRYLGFVFLNPVKSRGHIGALVDEGLRWGACGIKLHWLDGRITTEVGDVAQNRRLPVLYDPRGDIDIVRWCAHTYPDVAWIIPHLSSFEDDWRAQVALIEVLTRLPNVFADTSGVRFFDLIADAVRRAGAQKVIFGSDGPFLHPGVEIAKVRALRLAPDDEAKVLGGNICGIVGVNSLVRHRIEV